MKQVLAAFALAVLFLGVVFVCLPVQATEAGGVINQDTTWTASGSPYTLSKNTLVSTGVTLRVEPGVTVNMNNDCYLLVNGTLVAKGTEGSKINFNGGQLRFTEASTSYNEQTGAGSILENCVFTSGMERQVSVKFCSPKIANNVFNNQLYLVTSGSTLSNNVFNGEVRVSMGSNLITKNTFNKGLIFEETGGSGNLNAKVIENVFTGYSSGSGINVGINDMGSSHSIVIEKNLITKNSGGISVSTMISPTIRYNTIVNNNVGIQLLDYEKQTSIIKYNTLVNEQNLVLSQWVGCPDIDASSNYWGTTDTGQIDNSIHDYYDDFNLGKVNYQPILTQPDSNAPTSDLPTTTPTLTPESTPLVTQEPSTTPTEVDSGDSAAFRIKTNSTISACSFDTAMNQISFIVSGQEGTIGYVQLSIVKSLMPHADKIQVFLDGRPINRDVTSNDDYWTVTFTYHHSSHQVTINSSENVANQGFAGWFNIITIAAITAIVAVALGLVVLRKRKRTRIDNPKTD